MKQVLFATTALVALSLAGAAQASDPVKLGLGGYSKWVMSYADNNVTGSTYQGLDVKGTNEVHFKGSTTLDNGMKISAQIELEAGGGSDYTTDPIDASFITVSGGFGTIIAGTQWNGAYLLHVSAPDAGGFSEDSELGINGGTYLAKKGTIYAPITTAIDLPSAGGRHNKPETFTYVAPSFGGFTVGASYIPSLDEDNRSATINGTVTALSTTAVSDIIGFAGMYSGTFGAVSLKASLGYAFAADTESGVDHLRELATGAQLGYAGFTVGGAYKKLWAALDSGATLKGVGLDGTAWIAGIQYANGPYAVSFNYFDSNTGGDSITDIHVAGKYNLGAGVDLIGMVGYGEFEDNYVRYNDGWVVTAGMALTF